MGLVDHRLALFSVEAGEAAKHVQVSCVLWVWGEEGLSPEHAYLVNDVVPSARSLKLLSQQPVKFIPHLDDTASHSLDIFLPLLEQLGVVQDQSDQPCPVGWRVANLASLENGELTSDPVRDFGRGSDDVQGTDTFTVQTGVLGETLAD